MIFVLFSGATLVAQNFELQLLHYADVDGNEQSALDAVDEFSALVNFFQNDANYINNTLTVTSGDLIIPGPRFYAAENTAVRSLSGSNEPGHLDIAFANAFGVDASGFGNHEFDQGPGELFDAAFSSESSNGVTFPGSDFPWLSANIDFTADGDFSSIIGTDGDNVTNLNNQVAKYAIVTVDGETIGLVGAVAPSFPDITSIGNLSITPSQGSSVAQLAAEIQPSVDALEAAGVNKIILLAHMQSISIEKQLATLLDGVDIIVAGGSNTRMGDTNDDLFSNALVTDTAFDEPYPFQSIDAAGDPVLVVNVDGDYKYLGRLVVEFDNNGVIDLNELDDTLSGAYPSNESLVNSLSATPNPTVVALRDAVQGVISSQYNNVVGFSSVYLDGRRSQVRTQETNLGNLTADANLWYANLLNPAADAEVDISLKNGGGLRTEIGSAVLPGGSNNPNDIVFSPPTNNGLSEGHLRATLRFDNGLVRLTLTAAELINIIEHGLAEVAPGAEPGRFPQVGGMSFIYDPSLAAGSRLVNLIVDKGDADPSNDVVVLDNGVNVAPNGITFNMVTLNFLANGGDSYPFDQLSAANRINYYDGPGFGETVDFPDGDLANDPDNNSSFSYTGGEQDAVAEFMSTFHPDNASAYDIAETDIDQDTRIVVAQENLQITEIFSGQSGTDLTADWFEIHNTGDVAWVSGVDADLYYDDESADATTADLIQGITDIQPNERVIVLITDNTGGEVNTFISVWGEVVDLTGVKIGFTDGSGLGGGGDAVVVWLGDPLTTGTIIDTESYPDTASNDGQSYDVELATFSLSGNMSNATATLALGGSANKIPNVASPANAQPLPPTLVITEIFSGQEGTDLTEDWFEIHNTGSIPWISGVNEDLYYDDDSADGSAADLIQGITDIQPGERVIVLVTDNTGGEVATFNSVWGEVVDLTGIEIGFTDGSGLGGGGDGVTLWLGDPLTMSPIDIVTYPDTVANDGQTYDLELSEFSTVGNTSYAVETIALAGSAGNVPNIASPGNVIPAVPVLEITEIFSGQEGTDLTEDWFEIYNSGISAWTSGADEDLYYDDDSADGSAADLIQGITDIQPGERVIVLITDNTGGEVTNFSTIWGEVVDLTGIEIGFTDGSGLGGGGDAVTLWMGDPLTSMPVATGIYPDTAANDGQSFDLELSEFSVVGNTSFAVETLALGGNASDVPNIASPGNVPPAAPNLIITEIFSGQEGDDLTADWFEIHNTGTVAWTSGINEDLYYDDESADASTADLIQGVSIIPPGGYAIVLITDNTDGEVSTFNAVWSPVVDLTGVEVGYTDGAGLGGGGDAVNIWLGDPTVSMPIDTASYPDTASNDGQTYDVQLSAYSTIGNANNAVATTALGGDLMDVPNIGSPGNATATGTSVEVEFTEVYDSVLENEGSITLTVSISEAPTSDVTVDVDLLTGGTAVEGIDFTLASAQTLTFLAGSTDSQTIMIPILDNMDDGSDLYFMVNLQNPVGVAIGSEHTFSVYILDDDTIVPSENTSALDANYLASYLVDASGTAEITAYDPVSQRLFVTNSSSIEVLDFSDPSNISSISSISLPPNTSGVQSVAVSNGILAAAISADPSTDPGLVMFADTDGNNQVTVTVGALPDMITFTPDGTKLLSANEGEPNGDYSIDPEGSISIIDVTGGLAGIDQSDVTNLNFNAFDSQLATLLADGVRIFGPGATVSQDLEPEYIAVSDDNLMAYVALQENNALATIDLTTNTIVSVSSFGLKDHSLSNNSLDTSDETDFIFNASWPIYGVYMPDAIDYFNIGGTGYVITANEGDAREYNDFEEERKLGDSDYVLDPAIFGTADILALSTNLGDIGITNASGNTDGDSEYEEIHVFGGRSFSIFDASTGNMVSDSGNDFEVITAAHPTYRAIFNASNSNNSFKNRSDNKGPEPEGVIVQEINGSYYAFILLERIGGVMIYDVTTPSSPVFLQYLNSREAVAGGTESGDLGPEGIVFVSENDSPTDTALIIVSNEVSATLSIYSLDNITLGIEEFALNTNFSMFPNPAKDEVNFSKKDDYKVYDVSGRLVKQATNTQSFNISGLTPGLYLINNSKGLSKKLLIK